MALSQTCIEQHSKEDSISRRWAKCGLLCAAGLHAGLISLLALSPTPEKQERIELIVMASSQTSALAEPQLLEQAEEPTPVPEQWPPQSQQLEEPQNNPPQLLKESEDPDSKEESKEPEAAEDSKELDAAEELQEPEVTENSKTSEVAEEPEASDVSEDISEEPEDFTSEAVETAENLPAAAPVSNSAPPIRVATNSAPSLAIPLNIGPRASVPGTNETSDSSSEDTDSKNANPGDNSQNQPEARPQEPTRANSRRSQFGCRNCIRPDYPEAALDEAAEGEPQIEFEVDQDGNVISARLAQSSGSPALDQAALDAIRQSTFTAGGQGRSRTIAVDFSIEGTQRNRTARQRGERPTIEETATAEPASANNGTAATATPAPVENTTTVPAAKPAPDTDGTDIEQQPETPTTAENLSESSEDDEIADTQEQTPSSASPEPVTDTPHPEPLETPPSPNSQVSAEPQPSTPAVPASQTEIPPIPQTVTTPEPATVQESPVQVAPQPVLDNLSPVDESVPGS
ncbi:MAG: TonB family protein [Cyanobacteria bacterium P01_D01_bin.156]